MTYRWTHHKPLRRVSDDRVHPGDVFDPTDAERETFGDRMEEVADESEAAADSDAETEAGADSVAETPTPDGSETPLEERDYQELREMAMEADTDAINGRSSKAEIIAYFSDE